MGERYNARTDDYCKLTINVNWQAYQLLDALAEATGQTRGRVIEQLIRSGRSALTRRHREAFDALLASKGGRSAQ